MSDELDFEVIDESADQDSEVTTETTEDTTPSEENSEASSEDDTTSTKSKKSNWTKMSKVNKALKAENARLRKLAEQAKANTVVDDDDDDDIDYADDSFDKTEFRFFTIENPEAKEFKNEMEAVLNDYPNMSFEDALALVKAKTPKESKSSNDFSSKGSNVKARKRLIDLTDDEAVKLSPAQFLEHQRLTGKVK